MTSESLPKEGAVRRRHLRFEVKLRCQVLASDRSYPGTVKDISRSGLFVYTAARPAPGTVVTVVFPAAAPANELRVGGVVVRIEQKGAADPGARNTGGLGIEVPLGALGRLLGELLRRGRAEKNVGPRRIAARTRRLGS